MQYQMLAQKYRPRNLTDFVGQRETIRAITNALKHNRIHHTFLFLGPRGTGKTSLARVFTKCLNCQIKVSAQFCNECLICKSINENRFVDFFEIDAASRTRVEDIQKILENVNYKPTLGRYKVYLIDEVHMLSTHSFNALLKTLEEPPEHTVFILATTEAHRLPVTITSRALQFLFKNLSSENIIEKLVNILQQENMPYEETALQYIAQAAQGSLRDAINLLEQVILYNDLQKITAKDVAAILGYVSTSDLYRLIDAIHNKKIDDLYTLFHHLIEQGVNFEQVLSALMSQLHRIATVQLLPEINEQNEMVLQFAKCISPEQIQLYYQIALTGRKDLSFAPTIRQGFEMTLLRMCAFRPIGLDIEIQEEGVMMMVPVSDRKASVRPVKVEKKLSPEQHKSTEDLQEIKSHSSELNWHELLKKLPVNGLLKSLALHCTLNTYDKDRIRLRLDPVQKILYSKERESALQTVLSRYFKQDMRLEISIGNSMESLMSPAAIELEQSKAKTKLIQDSMLNNTGVKSIIERFNATIRENSILSKTEGIYE